MEKEGGKEEKKERRGKVERRKRNNGVVLFGITWIEYLQIRNDYAMKHLNSQFSG
jgi:hypothetical protein